MAAHISVKKPWVLALLLSVVVTAILYGRGLGMPFYSDDLLQVPWVESTPLVDIWNSANPYGRYRPLQFSIWRVVYLANGDLEPLTLRAANLAGHALCGTLLGLLLAHLRSRAVLAAPLGSVLFATFPFAFDAVLWPCALAYPLVVGLALGALLIRLRARGVPSKALNLCAIALTTLAGFAHESGVVVGALIVWAEVCLFVKRDYRWPALHVAASTLPLVLILRHSEAPSQLLSSGLGLDALAILVQSLAFPVAPVASVLGDSSVSWMLGIGLTAIIAIGVLMRRAGNGRWFFLGLGWAVCWAAVPLLTQPFDWLRDPPRALYPAAMGIAVLWAVALIGLTPRSTSLWRWSLWSVGLAVLLLPAPLFIREVTETYARGGALLWEVVRAGENEPNALFVNLPGRLTNQGRWYPLGHEGFIPLPPPSNASLLVKAHTRRYSAPVDRVAGGIMPTLPYSVELAGASLTPDDIRAARRVYVVVYTPECLRLEDVGGVVPTGTEPALPLATFGSEIDLLQVVCLEEQPDRFVLSTAWRVRREVVGEPTVFAHLRAADGSMLAQADGYPLGGLYPFSQWLPGSKVNDRRAFHLIEGRPSHLYFGIWYPAEGVRLVAIDSTGFRLNEDAFVCKIQGR